MFPETQWSRLAVATVNGSEDGREALGALYHVYREPVRRYILSRGWHVDEADDLAQSFFLHAMEHRVLRKAAPDRGKFRSFLLGTLNNFLLSELDRRKALKRGRGERTLPLDEARDHIEDGMSPERDFDRQWALAAMRAALEAVAADCRERRGPEAFAVIGRFLGMGPAGEASYESAARQLGLTTGALRTDVHMWRGKLRDRLRAEVQRTVVAPHEVQEELSYLRSLLTPA